MLIQVCLLDLYAYLPCLSTPLQPTFLFFFFFFCHLQTPLHLSVYLEQLEVVKALILKGVNTALQDRNGNTALHLACEQQSLECVELLLPLKKPASDMQTRKTLQDLQLQNWQGKGECGVITLGLMRAKSQRLNASLVTGFLSCLGFILFTPGLSCLHISTLKGNLHLMALLVQNGADINVQVS